MVWAIPMAVNWLSMLMITFWAVVHEDLVKCRVLGLNVIFVWVAPLWGIVTNDQLMTANWYLATKLWNIHPVKKTMRCAKKWGLWGTIFLAKISLKPTPALGQIDSKVSWGAHHPLHGAPFLKGWISPLWKPWILAKTTENCGFFKDRGADVANQT